PDASGSWHLPRVVGMRKALEIALLSDTVDAPEALRLSLVNRVVPADALAGHGRCARGLAPVARESRGPGRCAGGGNRSLAAAPGSWSHRGVWTHQGLDAKFVAARLARPIAG